MIEESPMDEVTDLIASIEMHRKEIERESGLEVSRTYSLQRLQQALLVEQEASQQPDANPVRVATAAALANEIAATATRKVATNHGVPPEMRSSHNEISGVKPPSIEET